MKPKIVLITISYNNGVDKEQKAILYYTNKYGLPEDRIRNALSELKAQSFVPGYYEMPEIAPVKNEFLPSYNGKDHAFVKLTHWAFIETFRGECNGDIQRLVDLIYVPDEIYGRRKGMYNQAKMILRDELNNLIEREPEEFESTIPVRFDCRSVVWNEIEVDVSEKEYEALKKAVKDNRFETEEQIAEFLGELRGDELFVLNSETVSGEKEISKDNKSYPTLIMRDLRIDEDDEDDQEVANNRG